MLSLCDCQNRDGGWPYSHGEPSWTEPTAYSLLALLTEGSCPEAVDRGLKWLRLTRRPDGGWSPHRDVPQSSWVTAVVSLLGPRVLSEEVWHSSIDWIVRQAGQETSWIVRLRSFITGESPGHPAWPWFPGTSSWVTPTALSILALRKAVRLGASPGIQNRIDQGAYYLLDHACSDGGWNHGAARVLDREAPSYPETTGVALLALSGRSAPAIQKACRRAQTQLATCNSSEAEIWLWLGLLGHRQIPPHGHSLARTPNTLQNHALAQLAQAAADGHSVFLD